MKVYERVKMARQSYERETGREAHRCFMAKDVEQDAIAEAVAAMHLPDSLTIDGPVSIKSRSVVVSANLPPGTIRWDDGEDAVPQADGVP